MTGASRSRSPRHERPPGEDRDAGDRGGDHDQRRRQDRGDRPHERHRDQDSDRPRRQRGFRWKEKRRDDPANDDDDRRRHDTSDYRGYRNRSPRRDRDRDRDYRGGPRDDRDRRRDPRRRDDDRGRPSASSSAAPPARPPPPATAAASGPGEEMIVVHINDRLGTKAAIPCFASDKVREFKIMVAARIGREPHEILLKRQGERPFKDQLSLEDYGVSNGVQLDLEVDTGD